nr:hypothetical protein [Tanacetum cinerariifolium]
MVLHGKVLELEDEAVEESRVDEPELGNPELDKLETIKPSDGMMCQGVRKEIQTKGVIDDSIHFDALGDMQEFVEMLISIVTRQTMKLARILDLLNHVILIAIGAIDPPRPFKDDWHNSSIKSSSFGRNKGVSGMSSGKNNSSKKAPVQEIKKKSLVEKPVLASSYNQNFRPKVLDDQVMHDKEECVLENIEEEYNIQTLMVEDSFNADLRKKEMECLIAYEDALKDEESMLKQRAKVDWLSEGDANTKFFHKAVKGNLNRNRIEYVDDMNGVKFSGQHVGAQFVKHFQSVFGEVKRVDSMIDMSSLFTKRLSREEAVYMVRPISKDEIKGVVFSMNDDKAPAKSQGGLVK